MTCAELEILLADYLDGTFVGAAGIEQKSAIESHLAGCADCAELARDAAGAMVFMERAAVVEAPRELTARILSSLESSGAMAKPSWLRRWFTGWFGGSLERPVLAGRALAGSDNAPRGIVMAVVSFAMAGSMLGRLGLEASRMNPAALAPTKVWTMAENSVYRSWDRAVMKYYDNVPLISEIQTQLTDLTADPEDPAVEQRFPVDDPAYANPAGPSREEIK